MKGAAGAACATCKTEFYLAIDGTCHQCAKTGLSRTILILIFVALVLVALGLVLGVRKSDKYRRFREWKNNHSAKVCCQGRIMVGLIRVVRARWGSGGTHLLRGQGMLFSFKLSSSALQQAIRCNGINEWVKRLERGPFTHSMARRVQFAAASL